MAKRKRETTKKQIENRLKEKRGQGVLDQYKPWLKIQDVGSKGLSTRIRGWKTNRIHHFLSKLELNCFYLFEWSQKVLDIRELFPLDLEETKAISQKLGIKHPIDPKTKELVVMTTDFLITIKSPVDSIEIARTVKYSNSLNSKRILEKFEIERVYWQNRGISWAIITEKDINPVIVENIKNLHFHRNFQNLPSKLSQQIIQQSIQLISQFFINESLLCEIIKNCSSALKISEETSLAVFYHLVANHYLEVDVTKPINPRKKICLQNSNTGGELL
jgi:hypothetical protein